PVSRAAAACSARSAIPPTAAIGLDSSLSADAGRAVLATMLSSCAETRLVSGSGWRLGPSSTQGWRTASDLKLASLAGRIMLASSNFRGACRVRDYGSASWRFLDLGQLGGHPGSGTIDADQIPSGRDET